MSIADEYVRKLAGVECDDWNHHILWKRQNPRDVLGYPAKVWRDDEENQKKLDEVEKAELRARCPFCIARATIAVADPGEPNLGICRCGKRHALNESTIKGPCWPTPGQVA